MKSITCLSIWIFTTFALRAETLVLPDLKLVPGDTFAKANVEQSCKVDHRAAPTDSIDSKRVRYGSRSPIQATIVANMSFDDWLKLSSMAGAVILFISSLLTYYYTKVQEFRKAFWEKQFDLYGRVTRAVSLIAIADDLENVKRERTEFWSLYWGELSTIENATVLSAMVDFGKRLQTLERPGSVQLTKIENSEAVQESDGQAMDLRLLSCHLAIACRESLDETWKPTQLDDLKKKWEALLKH